LDLKKVRRVAAKQKCGTAVGRSSKITEARVADNEAKFPRQNREHPDWLGYFRLRFVMLTSAKGTARRPADSSDPNAID
jgi:hypothetical protein